MMCHAEKTRIGTSWMRLWLLDWNAKNVDPKKQYFDFYLFQSVFHFFGIAYHIYFLNEIT